MIPITAGVITGTAGADAGRGRVVALTLPCCRSALYALLGVIAGLSGQRWHRAAWARFHCKPAAVFGLAMLGALPVPSTRLGTGCIAQAAAPPPSSSGRDIRHRRGTVRRACIRRRADVGRCDRQRCNGFVYLFAFSSACRRC